jgi:hypothetical protein
MVSTENLNRGFLYWAIQFRGDDLVSVWQTTEKHKCLRLLVEEDGENKTAYLMADDKEHATMLARIRLGLNEWAEEEE